MFVLIIVLCINVQLHRLVKCDVTAHERQKVFLDFHFWGEILMKYQNIWQISFKNMDFGLLDQKALGREAILDLGQIFQKCFVDRQKSKIFLIFVLISSLCVLMSYSRRNLNLFIEN